MLVLDAATVLRFGGGSPQLHNARRPGPAVALSDAGTIACIASFAVPQDPASVVERLPEVVRPRVQALIAALQERGMLVPAAQPATLAAAVPAAQALSAMATQLHLLAQDAACLRPAVQADSAGVLEATLAAYSTLRQQYRAAHDAQLAERLRGLVPPPEGWQLHLGAGTSRIQGWLGLDADPQAELPLNLSHGLPFPDASVRRIYAAHLLEHLYYPDGVLALLGECRRVLQPGGRLRLVVPDIAQCLHAYARNDTAFFAQRRQTWTHWPEGRTPLEDFLAYAGAGPDPARALDSHKYGYDFVTLDKALRQAGFTTVEQSQFGASSDPDLCLDSHSFAAGAEHAEGHYALFVEAAGD